MTRPDQGFDTTVDYGLVESVSAELPPYIAYVAPEPFALAADRLARQPLEVVEAGMMEQNALEEVARRAAASEAEAVVGIGGGSAIDTAKFVAWRSGLPFWQFPSIASVDAVFTKPAGVRIDRRVRYVGSAVPQLVAVDLDLVLGAPPALNRAGAGDILSCHTGLADWRYAESQGGRVPPVDPHLVELAQGWLTQLTEQVGTVAAAGEDGVRFLTATLREVGTTCDAVGFSFFEEGSEHYFAYCLEHLTGLHLVHGELVALGIIAMSIAQQNDPAGVEALVQQLRLRYRPADLGIEADDFRRVLEALPAFCEEEGFPPSAAGALDAATRREIIERLVEA
jgi:glycerol dehydrogenase-like iron-containing ADH family enzyme